MGQKNEGGTHKPKIVLKGKPNLPATAKPEPDRIYDLEMLGNMDRSALVEFIALECRKHKITTASQLGESEALRPLATAAKLAGVMGDIFRETETRLEKSPHHVQSPTVRPPPRRQPPDAPPVSVQSGQGPVTGEEDTVAVVSEQVPVPSRPPPAPKTLPPPRRFDLVDLEEGKKLIYDDNTLRTRQTYEKLRELLVGAANSAVELHKLEVASIAQYCENDQRKLAALQDRAKSLFESGSPLPGPEARLIELVQVRDALAAILKSDNPEPVLKRFMDYLNAKAGRGMRPGRLEGYVDKLRELHSDVMTKKSQADREDELRAIRSSRQPSPKNGTKPPEKTPLSAASAGDPAFVQDAAGKKMPSVPPVRKSEPPVARPQDAPGRLRRFFTNPMTWTIGGIGGFTGSLVYKDAFQEMARGLGMLLHDKLHVTDFQFTKMHMYVGYAGILLFTLATTELLRRRAAGKKAKLYAELAGYSRDEREREKRVIAKLTDISLRYDKWDDQVTHLRIALLQDSQFMEDLYEMRKHKLFNDILADARIHPKLVQNLNLIFERVKMEKLQKRLTKVAEVLLDPKERVTILTKFYQEDPIFRRTMDELFQDNGAGNYVNMDKQNQAFAVVLDHNDKNVGKELQKALQNDYVALKA